MAAGLGFKTFATGDVLSAGDTNGYLMQGVLVFADAAARTAAITSPQEGQTSYLKDTDVIQVYSGSAWVTKSGGSSPLTTKGDLYGYSTTDARVAVGTNGQVLKADSTAATGVAWANSGLTLITTATVSAGAALNVNNCFTSAYANYYITGWIYGTTTIELYMRMRVSGADNTTADYARQSLQSLGTTTASARTTGATAWTIGANNSGTKKTYLNMTIFSPQLSESTAMLRNNNNDTNTSIENYYGAHWFNASTAFDGFSLYGGSGNSTAEISIYGLSK